jgi:hypothetical protein
MLIFLFGVNERYCFRDSPQSSIWTLVLCGTELNTLLLAVEWKKRFEFLKASVLSTSYFTNFPKESRFFPKSNTFS